LRYHTFFGGRCGGSPVAGPAFLTGNGLELIEAFLDTLSGPLHELEDEWAPSQQL
jgi:hypothetical protein